MPTDMRKFYQRGQYLHGATHRVMSHITKGMFVKGGPIGGARMLKRRKNPDTSLAEVERRLDAARAKLEAIRAAVWAGKQP